MKKELKTNQIVVRFNGHAYDKIKEYAEIEHRGMGEFVRHATLDYIENFEISNRGKPAETEKRKTKGGGNP